MSFSSFPLLLTMVYRWLLQYVIYPIFITFTPRTIECHWRKCDKRCLKRTEKCIISLAVNQVYNALGEILNT